MIVRIIVTSLATRVAIDLVQLVGLDAETIRTNAFTTRRNAVMKCWLRTCKLNLLFNWSNFQMVNGTVQVVTTNRQVNVQSVTQQATLSAQIIDASYSHYDVTRSMIVEIIRTRVRSFAVSSLVLHNQAAFSSLCHL